jgi:hypothetical protein
MMDFLDEEITTKESENVLLVSRYIYLNKILIGLLKFLLERKAAKGIFIAVDRPYIYTSRLLTKHKVPQDNLFFLDIVSLISSEKIPKTPNVEMVESPFCMDLHNETLRLLDKFGSERGDINFVFLDNITVMLNYIDDECLYGFLGKLVIKMSEEGKMVTITIVDKDSHPKVYERAKANADREVEITEDILRS